MGSDKTIPFGAARCGGRNHGVLPQRLFGDAGLCRQDIRQIERGRAWCERMCRGGHTTDSNSAY